jgi:methylated-DNA-[protein]-cysteine S-methyltransferase
MRRSRTSAGRSYLIQGTPIGLFGVVAGESGLVEIMLQPSADLLQRQISVRHPQAQQASCPLLRETVGQVEAYFRRERLSFLLPLDFSGLTPFMINILQNLQELPFGKTLSYGQLALVSGYPGAARAVGGAMAANPFPLVIPCHRVLGAGGKLAGYSGGEGILTKKWLLSFEQECAGTALHFA